MKYYLAMAVIQLALGLKVYGQKHIAAEKLLVQTQKFYGKSDLLYNGNIYQPGKRGAKGNPFFCNEFLVSTLNISGDTFCTVYSKYDLADDRLIIACTNDSGKWIIYIAEENRVKEFYLGNKKFVRADTVLEKHALKGYFSTIQEGRYKVYIKYRKKFIDTYDDITPYGYYSETKQEYYVWDGYQLRPFTDKTSFLQLFEEQKKLLRKYIRKQRLSFSVMNNEQLIRLMQYCNEIYGTKKI